MNVAEIALAFQALSSLSLTGGFIFAAIQFRNLRRAQHVANFTKLVELQMHLRELRVHEPSLARVYHHDLEGLCDDRAVREYFFNLMQLSVFEIVWFAYRNKQVPQDYFESWVKRMSDIAAEPSFRAMMGRPAMKILHDDFQAYVEALVKATPAHPGPMPTYAANPTASAHAPGPSKSAATLSSTKATPTDTPGR